MIGAVVVGSSIEYGYEYGMLLNSVLSFCGGIIVICCLIPHPKDINLQPEDGKGKERLEKHESNHTHIKHIR